ncbi:uncharacterized protein PHALS_09992 [Plasmopara halstedii]|uniref:Uncharacterized protein n=1 Tax=Plasmopara halstedii TaxID=4781 RepID=A0A0P1AGN8_PLAHL|nr:uncharacterized protein PHALS_09992 [Plasmopara halstedii]CEG39756.1 hypothetical protein PHALS_09992 [Plasmopara halstedii]|eukprot:XP_024576125.1 hypothetical protein PHALS_09992 [Plasmopara halstedii]
MLDELVEANVEEVEQEGDLCDSNAVQTRIQQLKERIAKLDDSSQVLKLLAEEQAAEINAKEVLLTRKSEHVDELLEQIKKLNLKFDPKCVESQTPELEMQQLNAHINELREQVKQNEEAFSMVCAALTAREKLMSQKDDELSTAIIIEKELRKEVGQQQAIIRRLEKTVEDLQPQKVDACLSPRSFRENQLIRLRDEAIDAKTREVWLLSGQYDRLRVQLGEQESALERLQINVTSKENDLMQQQRKINRLEAEIETLQAGLSQAEGCEKAINIATTQNAKLLKTLEASELVVDDLKSRLDVKERECEQLRTSLREYTKRSAESEVEVLNKTMQAEGKILLVNGLQEKARREREMMQKELFVSNSNYQMEIEKLQGELVMRRNKQYELTLQLQIIESQLHEAIVCRESADEQLLACQCQIREFERVLQDSFEWKKKIEKEMALEKTNAAKQVEEQRKMLATEKRELAKLQRQHEEVKEQLDKRFAQDKQRELLILDTKQLLSAQEALSSKKKGRINDNNKGVEFESEARIAVKLKKDRSENQLEALRQQTESNVRKYADKKRQIHEKKQRLKKEFSDLLTEFRAVQSAKSKLVRKYTDVLGKATSNCFLGIFDLRKCWLVDDDLPPILSLLGSKEYERQLQRVDLRCNRLTSEGMGRILVLVKKMVLNLASQTTNMIREVDLRRNYVSLDGIRLIAKGLESLIPDKNNTRRTGEIELKSVAVTKDGRIEVYAVGSVNSNRFLKPICENLDIEPQVPILVVDVSENLDAEWLFADSKLYQADSRSKDLNISSEGKFPRL